MCTTELHSIIKELKEFKLLKEEAEAKISELENAIKAELKEKETNSLNVEEYKVTLSVINSNRIDSKTLQTELPDVYSRYSKLSTYERLTVK